MRPRKRSACFESMDPWASMLSIRDLSSSLRSGVCPTFSSLCWEFDKSTWRPSILNFCQRVKISLPSVAYFNPSSLNRVSMHQEDPRGIWKKLLPAQNAKIIIEAFPSQLENHHTNVPNSQAHSQKPCYAPNSSKWNRVEPYEFWPLAVRILHCHPQGLSVLAVDCKLAVCWFQIVAPTKDFRKAWAWKKFESIRNHRRQNANGSNGLQMDGAFQAAPPSSSSPQQEQSSITRVLSDCLMPKRRPINLVLPDVSLSSKKIQPFCSSSTVSAQVAHSKSSSSLTVMLRKVEAFKPFASLRRVSMDMDGRLAVG